MLNKSKLTKTPLESDLSRFCNDFAEFQDSCSFMCDTFACIATGFECFGTEEMDLDKNTVVGARRFSRWIKRRSEELERDLKQIHEKASIQSQISSKVNNKNLMRKSKKTHST